MNTTTTEIKSKQKSIPSCKSVVFSWNEQDFYNLLKTCDWDGAVQLTLEYLHDKNAKILEAGCGLGKAVKYFHDLGYKNVYGIEINPDSVNVIKKLHPELNVMQGDVTRMPYPKNYFDVVASYGVVEHFPAGPQEPLKATYDVLKPGGIAVITVPTFNTIRKLQYLFAYLDPRKYNFIRRMFGKKPFHFNGKKYGWYIDPQLGEFYEYRFTKKQFEKLCKQAGFQVVKNVPISHIDGLFHSPFRPLLSFKNWEFHVSKAGKVVNWLFSKIPFFHNHMHACVVRKPQA